MHAVSTETSNFWSNTPVRLCDFHRLYDVHIPRITISEPFLHSHTIITWPMKVPRTLGNELFQFPHL